jgi:hypothetical protein
MMPMTTRKMMKIRDPAAMNPIGMRHVRWITTSSGIVRRRPGSSTRKLAMMKSQTTTILMRGSMRCTNDPVSTYWPKTTLRWSSSI